MVLPSTRAAVAVIVSFLSIFGAVIAPAEIEIQGAADQNGESDADANGVADRENPAPDIVKFKNDDILHGLMVSMSPSEGLKWTTPESNKPITFKMDHIVSVGLGHVQSPEGEVDAAVSLTNGDILRGKLLELTPDKLVLKTGYAGVLNVARPMVSGIVPAGGNGGSLYRGPTTLNDWTVLNNRGGDFVKIKNGVLFLSRRAAVTRDMHLRKRSLMEFHYKTDGSGQLRVILYQKGAKGREGYYLVLSPGYAYLQKRINNGSTTYGNSPVSPLRARKGKISIYSDLESGDIFLYVNGKKAKQWNGDNFGEGGTFFGFASNSGGGSYEISQIIIKPWSGKLPSNNAADAKESLDEDFIVFVNKDQVSGKLKTIKDGVVVFATDYAELKIPIQRVARIVMSEKGARRARRNSGDAQLLLGNGGAITLNVDSISNGVVKGKSENFGTANIKTKALCTIRFNIYSEDDE